MVPLVAIVGRPNVGKSTLLNAISGKRIAIVEEIAGVTRDRVTIDISWEGRDFVLMDTGGVGMVDVADIAGHVEEQIEFALDEANLILFIVDIRDGVTALDRKVAQSLRKLDCPVILVANKAETRKLEMGAAEFHSLGMGEPQIISAQNRMGTLDLLDRVVETLPESDGETHARGTGLKIALVGRRNAGKSTFLNQVAGSERVIVSEHPGTTRDSVDVRVEVEGRVYTLIDTAGVQRAKRISGTLEYLSQHRTERSVRRADAVLLLLDVKVDIGELDKKTAEYSLAQGKPTMIVGNKWDLIEPERTTEDFVNYIHAKLPAVHFAPISFASALTGKSVLKILKVTEELAAQARVRVGTGELNRVLHEALEERSPRVKKSRVPKLLYASQTGVEPPTIIAFVNDPDLFDPAYRRFMERRIREAFPFPEVPIRLILRRRRQQERFQKPGK